MQILQANWSSIKQLANNYSVPIQWIDLGNVYYLRVYQDNMIAECYLSKTDSADITDFQTNYQNKGNLPVKHQNVNVLGTDTLVLNPFGSFFSPSAGTTSIIDIEIPFTCVLKGGILFSQDATLGDYVSVSIVDKNNVLGQGGTPTNPTLVATYITQWYIMPGEENSVENISISSSLAQGLFIRISYTSTSTSPKVIMNFLSYQTI